MRFGKTLSDIRSLGSVSGGDIGLYEILDILLDVLLDAGQETNRQLSALPVSAEAAAKWVAVATALNSIPFEAETLAALTGRRRDKLLRLQKELAEKEAGARRAAKEAEALKKEEDQLTERIEQCGKKAEALRRLQQTVAEMQAEAERLETEIADLGEVDADSVSERRAELQRLKKERTLRKRRTGWQPPNGSGRKKSRSWRTEWRRWGRRRRRPPSGWRQRTRRPTKSASGSRCCRPNTTKSAPKCSGCAPRARSWTPNRSSSAR